MTSLHRVDLTLATIAAALPLGFVLLNGDPMFLGAGYFVIVPSLLVAGCLALNAAPLFITGASLVVSLTYIPFIAYSLGSARPEGLIGFGHLFSMPGAFAFALLGAWYSSREKSAPAMLALFFGFLSTLAGYAINQLAVCNTLVYCGGIFPIAG